MNSITTRFLFCCALIFALSVNAHGDDWPVGKGDVTGDGIIDGRDALVILQHLEGIITLTPEQIERGDVYPNPGTGGRQTGDGTLTREDAQTILDYTVGLTPLGDLTGDYSHSQPFIEAITPISGKVGDEVTLVGRNFPTGNIANTEVYLGETRAEIVSITGSMITIIVPEGASSGRFRLNTLGGATFSHTTFSVLEIIDAVLEIDSGLDIRNFLVFSSHDYHEFDSTTDRFSLFGPKDEITLYQAATFNDDNPNLYQYFYIPGYSPLGAPIRINALSTAKAMLFTDPFIATKDAVRAATLFRLMEDLPETHELADAISKKFPQGANVFEDEEFILLLDSALDALFDAIFADIDAIENSLAALRDDRSIQATITPSAPSSSPPSISIRPATINDVDAPVMIRRYDMDYLQAAYRKSDHSIVIGLGEAIFDPYTNEVIDISDGYSPVDWVVTMYKLDPDDFPTALSMSAVAMQTKGFTNSLVSVAESLFFLE